MLLPRFTAIFLLTPSVLVVDYKGGGDPMMMAVKQMAANVAEVGVRGAWDEPKGVMDSYRKTYPVLLPRFCQVATPMEELAPIWGRLARGTKGEQQSRIQHAELSRVCTE